VDVQNGQLKARIEGANTPAINSNVVMLTPVNAEMDDLEVGWPAGLRRSGTKHDCAAHQGHLCRLLPQENPVYLAKSERERIARGETVTTRKKGKK
jgi:hypothetical protein